MDTYSLLRTLADSWALLALTLIFLGMIIFVFRPGARKSHRDAATSIFRNDDRPAPDSDDRPASDSDHDKEDR